MSIRRLHSAAYAATKMVALTEILCHHSRQTEWSLLCTATLRLVLNDRNQDDLIKMDQGSIVSATKRKASPEASRSNVQACSKPARELTRSDKREITALDKKVSCRCTRTQSLRLG